MDVHEETIDDLSGEGAIIIDGERLDQVSYCLSIAPEPGGLLAEGSITGPEELITKIRRGGHVELVLEDGPVVSLRCEGGENDTEWVSALQR